MTARDAVDGLVGEQGDGGIAEVPVVFIEAFGFGEHAGGFLAGEDLRAFGFAVFPGDVVADAGVEGGVAGVGFG